MRSFGGRCPLYSVSHAWVLDRVAVVADVVVRDLAIRTRHGDRDPALHGLRSILPRRRRRERLDVATGDRRPGDREVTHVDAARRGETRARGRHARPRVGAGPDGGRTVGACAAASTSERVMRCPGPDPRSDVTSTPLRSARWRTRGDSTGGRCTCVVCSTGLARSTGADATGSTCTATNGSFAPTSVASTVPTGTFTRRRRPAHRCGGRLRRSPRRCRPCRCRSRRRHRPYARHRRAPPSIRDRAGVHVGAERRHPELTHRDAARIRPRRRSFDLRERGPLHVCRVRHGHLRAAHRPTGASSSQEGRLHDAGAHLRRQAPAAPALVDDDGAVRARDRVDDGVVVERSQRPQVDHFGIDAVRRELLRGLQRPSERAAVRDEREVGPGTTDRGAVDVTALHDPSSSPSAL